MLGPCGSWISIGNPPWATASEKRVRLLSGIRFAFGLLVVLLGLTVYRAAEARSPADPEDYTLLPRVEAAPGFQTGLTLPSPGG